MRNKYLRIAKLLVLIFTLLIVTTACGNTQNDVESGESALDSVQNMQIDVPEQVPADMPENEHGSENDSDSEAEYESASEPEPEYQPVPEPETIYELTPWPEPLPEIGDVITLGDFEWRVLDLQENMALILSEYILDSMSYNIMFSTDRTRWEDSNVRRFLNENFYSGLPGEFRVRIAETINTNSSRRGTVLDFDTADRLFLLSVEEVAKYFGDSGQLGGFGMFIDDEYNYGRIAINLFGDAGRWWLRCVGFEDNLAVLIMDQGTIFRSGEIASIASAGVRPAMWIYL